MKWHFGAAGPVPRAARTKEGKQLIHGGVFIVHLPTTAIVQYDGICSEDQLIIRVRAEMKYIEGDVLLLLLGCRPVWEYTPPALKTSVSDGIFWNRH